MSIEGIIKSRQGNQGGPEPTLNDSKNQHEDDYGSREWRSGNSVASLMDGDYEMQTTKTVEVYFVQDGASCSKEMREAYSVCQEAKLHPKIISEDTVHDLSSFEPNIVFVLEAFSGEIFDFLSTKNCLIVGPPCLYNCLKDSIPIPNNGSPVYNIVLRGVVISSSKLHSKQREEVKKLCGFMGGVYSDDLTLAVTHLITEKGMLSGKCCKAAENNIPIISPEWIRKSWELSESGLKAPEALKFKLPPFKGMYISCSNLSMSAKNKLKQVIEANGGIYQPNLEMKRTCVLVVGEAEGKKWQFAQQWEIPCLRPEWIYASAERGTLLPSREFLVAPRVKCSTPTHSVDNDSFMSANLSVVPFSASEKSNIDETNSSFGSEISVRSVRSEVRPQRAGHDYKKLLDQLSMNEIKNAGLFLDGCKIFLSGFTPLELEKLKKVINYGGATLFPSVSDCLSHVIVGEFSLSDAKELSALNPRPCVVKLDWLIECIKEKTTVNVEPYLCLTSVSAPPASPLSSKGLKLLKGDTGSEGGTPTADSSVSRATVSRKLFVKANVMKPNASSVSSPLSGGLSIDVSALERRALEEMNKEKEVTGPTHQEAAGGGGSGGGGGGGLKEAAAETAGQTAVAREEQLSGPAPAETRPAEQSKETSAATDLTSQSTLDNEPFFQGLCFELLIFGDVELIEESIELKGGRLVSSEDPAAPVPDYAIVPVEGTDIQTSAKNIVTPIFLDDCYDTGCLVTELQYYHLPLPQLASPQTKLEGSVLTLSGFPRAEKRLLEHVASTLGGTVQVMFSRSEYPDKGVRKSSHLLCNEMSGKKYEAAIKWGVPVVTSAWLLDLLGPPPPPPPQTAALPRRSSASILSQSIPEGVGMEPSSGINGKVESALVPLSSKNNLKRLSDEALHRKEGDEMETAGLTGSTPEVIKRWKSNEMGQSPKVKRPKSPPTTVLMKQLWAKCGGVSYDGIEGGTGKLLKDGPYGEYARSSASPASPMVELPGATPPAGSSGEATPTTRRWKNFANVFSSFGNEGTPPIEPPKPRRPSTPLDVLKKQLWTQVGGVNFEGIEPVTGKLLKDGPYSTWARDSLSRENSLVEPAQNSPDREQESTRSTGDRNVSVTTPKPGTSMAEEKSATYPHLTCSPFLRPSGTEPVTEVPETEVPPSEDPHSTTLHFNPKHSSTICEGFGSKRTSEPVSATHEKASKSADVGCKENIPANVSRAPGIPKQRSVDFGSLTVSERPEGSLKIFVISGLPPETKLKYEGILRGLGGGVAQSPSYDPSSSHIIIEKLIRSEKLLCCIAAGKWVLHTSYVDFCYEARELLAEEEFEWGNPLASSRLPRLEPGSTEAAFANAAYKWRLKKRDLGSAAPFRDMQVVLRVTESKAPQFRRLLDAGGATVLGKHEIHKANYVIWEAEKVEMGVPLSQLAARKVHVVPPVFLGEYLVSSPSPQLHYPPAYLRAVKEIKCHRT